MGEVIRRALSFGEGANTSETGISSQPVWRNFDEADVSGGGNRRRLGRKKLTQFSTTALIVDADGVNDLILFGQFATGGFLTTSTRWTMEVLFKTTSLAANRTIMGSPASAATPILVTHTTGSTVTVVVKDSASANVTLTFTGVPVSTVCALMLTRDGASLVGYLNGVTATGTMSATLGLATGAITLFADNAAAFFIGGVDYLRFLSTVETSPRSGWMRLPDPRAENVVADWLIALDANNYCLDRSKNEYHGTATGSPATTRTPLCYNPDPVIGLGTTFDKSGARLGYAIVGDGVVPFTYT